MFTKGFGHYVCPGDTIECKVDGFTVRAKVEFDEHSIPWEPDDGHGPVSEWTTRDKAPGERVLCTEGRLRRYYDFQEAVQIAKRDGWGATPVIEGESARRKATRAAEQDFAVLKAWCNDEWFYCGIVLSVAKAGITLASHAASVWGIACNHPYGNPDYLLEVANELLPDALDEARKALARLMEDLPHVSI